jgi:endonuclease/exonuclease/phosphatase family metal-dependent hydrolase
MSMLARTWNVFHGNAFPPERRALLAEMVRLASADQPDVLCLQELPVWSLPCLREWSGMTAVGDVTARPLLPAPLAKAVTDLHHGLFRSAFTGQANAILLAPRLRVVERRVIELERSEHRICQGILLEGGIAVGNLHANGERRGAGDAEVERAVGLLDALGGEVAILAGDFNFRPRPAGFSEPGAGIDHVLVRGAPASPEEPWPLERRTLHGRVLSDHAPVEVTVDV